jgi:hypothetical protein
MKATLYLETTIPSYLTAWPSRNPLRASHQAITKEWWAKRRQHFQIFVSPIVLAESAMGDRAATAERFRLLADLPRLEVTAEAEDLALDLIGPKALPRKAERDAFHVAIAAVHQLHFLLTWNCRHLANEDILQEVRRRCQAAGFNCPVVCTPETLMGL